MDYMQKCLQSPRPITRGEIARSNSRIADLKRALVTGLSIGVILKSCRKHVSFVR